MAKVITVCRSKEKGARKEAIAEGIIKKNYGLLGDAHADSSTHRQVSLLAIESINKMREDGFEVGPGDFAENLTTVGLDVSSLPVGTVLSVGEDVLLEITQIGKDCHSGCAIFRQIGKCIMPKKGVFTRVLRDGTVRAEDEMKVSGVCNEK